MIVPVRNGEATLDRCVRSLLAVDYPTDRLELIFVDNDSRDGTASVLRRHSAEIRIRTAARLGAGAARNAGLEAATGEIAAFTDADCTVDRDWLRALVTAIDGQPDRVVGGRILATRPANRCEIFGERIHDHRAAIEAFEPPYVITMNCAASLSGPLRDTRFDEDFRRCQDVDLSYRLLALGCTFEYADGAVVYHHNEATLAGLFREGVQHGFYSVQARRKHRALIRAHRQPVIGFRAGRSLASKLLDAMRGGDRSGPELAFLSGKAIGGVAGAARFRYPAT